MCVGSKRYQVEYTVSTGNFLQGDINNPCLKCSLILSVADGGAYPKAHPLLWFPHPPLLDMGGIGSLETPSASASARQGYYYTFLWLAGRCCQSFQPRPQTSSSAVTIFAQMIPFPPCRSFMRSLSSTFYKDTAVYREMNPRQSLPARKSTCGVCRPNSHKHGVHGQTSSWLVLQSGRNSTVTTPLALLSEAKEMAKVGWCVACATDVGLLALLNHG